MTSMPETQYAQSGELSIAYQSVGDGPLDILFIPGFVSNVELMWENPRSGRHVRPLRGARAASCSSTSAAPAARTGRSAPAAPRTGWTTRAAVADAAGIEQAVVIGLSEGGPLAILFATAFPERVRSLVLWGTFARSSWRRTTRSGSTPCSPTHSSTIIRERWGTGHALEFVPRRRGGRGARGARSLRAPDRVAGRGRDDPAPQREHGRPPRARCRAGADARRAPHRRPDRAGPAGARTSPTTSPMRRCRDPRRLPRRDGSPATRMLRSTRSRSSSPARRSSATSTSTACS